MRFNFGTSLIYIKKRLNSTHDGNILCTETSIPSANEKIVISRLFQMEAVRENKTCQDFVVN